MAPMQAMVTTREKGMEETCLAENDKKLMVYECRSKCFQLMQESRCLSIVFAVVASCFRELWTFVRSGFCLIENVFMGQKCNNAIYLTRLDEAPRWCFTCRTSELAHRKEEWELQRL